MYSKAQRRYRDIVLYEGKYESIELWGLQERVRAPDAPESPPVRFLYCRGVRYAVVDARTHRGCFLRSCAM